MVRRCPAKPSDDRRGGGGARAGVTGTTEAMRAIVWLGPVYGVMELDHGGLADGPYEQLNAAGGPR
jgi:hypothetical protein